MNTSQEQDLLEQLHHIIHEGVAIHSVGFDDDDRNVALGEPPSGLNIAIRAAELASQIEQSPFSE